MKNMTTKLRLAVMAGLLATTACATPAPHYYRVFRGAKRLDLSTEEFHKRLLKEFIPAAPALQEQLGTRAYVPALPAQDKPSWMADEFALVAYDSEADYREGRQSLGGKSYGDLHWAVFDRERTKTGGAQALDDSVEPETPYDILQKPVDWQSGYVTFFIGTRKSGVSEQEFLKRMHRHVIEVKQAFEGKGLGGYVMVANGQYEAAWQRWTSKEAADAAFASPAGQAVIADARSLMDGLQFGQATRFEGTLKPGQAVLVPLKTSSSR